MKNKTVEPLFNLLEAGLFIDHANTLIDRYHLRARWDKQEGDLLLGRKLGPLPNRQVLCLMSAAVSRLVGNLPYVPSDQDFSIHRTLLALYRGFCQSFLRNFPDQPEEHALFLRSFLDRAADLARRRAVTSQCLSQHHGDWVFVVDVGESLLKKLFPIMPRAGHINLPPFSGYESDWLEDVARQLRFCIPQAMQPAPPAHRPLPGRPVLART
jgi:hypothetical protein